MKSFHIFFFYPIPIFGPRKMRSDALGSSISFNFFLETTKNIKFNHQVYINKLILLNYTFDNHWLTYPEFLARRIIRKSRTALILVKIVFGKTFVGQLLFLKLKNKCLKIFQDSYAMNIDYKHRIHNNLLLIDLPLNMDL